MPVSEGKLITNSGISGFVSTTGNETISGSKTFSAGVTVRDANFIIQDDADNTKQAQFQVSAVASGVTRTYTLPDTSGNVVLNNLNTTTLGAVTATSTINIGTLGTLSGNTKAINIGTAGVSGSTTNITLGSSVSGAASTIIAQADLFLRSTAPANIGAAATLTVANLQTGVINYTGAAANVTFPTGTTLDAGWPAAATDTGFTFSVINTGTGAATMTANTGVTILGAAAVANGTSAQWRLRRTGAATYVAMRLA